MQSEHCTHPNLSIKNIKFNRHNNNTRLNNTTNSIRVTKLIPEFLLRCDAYRRHFIIDLSFCINSSKRYFRYKLYA